MSVRSDGDVSVTGTYYSYIVKLVLIGDSGIGKSSLLQRYLADTYSYDTPATVGVEFGTAVENFRSSGYQDTIKLQIWDTGGSERFRSIAKSYYRNTAGVLLMFDITDKESFAHIRTWYDDFMDICLNADSIAVVVVATKYDTGKSESYHVDDASVNAFLETIPLRSRAGYIKTSSAKRLYCHEPFRAVSQLIYEKIMAGIYEQRRIHGVSYNDERFFAGRYIGPCLAPPANNNLSTGARIVVDGDGDALLDNNTDRQRSKRCKCTVG